MAGSTSARDPKEVTIEKMDYSYIENCSNEKEIANILRALRSGREGFYPNLIEFCEKKLKSLNPENRTLRKQQPILKEWDLDQNTIKNLTSDLDCWGQKMKKLNEEVSEKKMFEENLCPSQGNGFGDHNDLPPVRGTKTMKGSKKVISKDAPKTGDAQRIKSFDYKSWDKFDVENECRRIDEEESTVSPGPSSVSISKSVDSSNLSGEEIVLKAIQEKEKGNEAFKSGDFEEALSYYCRSISLQPIAASYNNRALVYLRLEKWHEAVSDCNTVLSFEGESGNLKAMMRRATAYKSLKQYKEAVCDLKYVLEKEPNNARAKTILDEISKIQRDCLKPATEEPVVKKGKKMIITEVEGESSSDEKLALCSPSHVVNKEVPITQHPSKDDKPMETGMENSSTTKVMTQNASSKRIKATDTNNGKKVDTLTNSLASVQCENSNATVAVYPPYIDDLKTKGGEFFRSGRYGDACDHYSKAIHDMSLICNNEANPGHYLASAVLYNNRAACWLKLGNDKACIQDCVKVLEIKKWDNKAFLRRATAYENMEKYTLAWADYQSSLSMDWGNASAQSGANRMSAHLKELYGNKWREMVPKIKRYPYHRNLLEQSTESASEPTINMQETSTARTSNSDDTVTFKTPVESLPIKNNKKNIEDTVPSKSSKKKKNKNKKRAKHNSPNKADTPHQDRDEIEEKKMKIRREVFEKLKSDGNEHVKMGEYQLAIDSYTKCLAICPKETASYTNRALCFLKLKKHVSAINDCTEAIKLDPINVKAYYRRSLARKGEGFYKDAQRDMEKLLSIDPSNKAAKKELLYLNNLVKNQKVPVEENDSNEKEPPVKHKKKMIIEEVDSSSSSDEAEFILPNDKFIGNETMNPASHNSTRSKVALAPNSQREVRQQNIESTTEMAVDDSESLQSPAKAGEPKEATGKSKAENSGNLMASEPVRNLHEKFPEKPLTPYEFGNLWSAIADKSDIGKYKALLDKVEPLDLPSLLSNKTDDHIIITIARICKEYSTSFGNPERGYRMMKSLTGAKRFAMAAMFLLDPEKDVIREALEALQQHVGEVYSDCDIRALYKEYGL